MKERFSKRRTEAAIIPAPIPAATKPRFDITAVPCCPISRSITASTARAALGNTVHAGKFPIARLQDHGRTIWHTTTGRQL
jgi:hypothetical protein